MEKVRLALVIITIAIAVGPILGVVLVYRDNLSGLFIPPEINQITNILGGNPENPGQPGQNGQSGNGTNPYGIIPPTPEDIQYDPVTRVFTASFQMKNPVPFLPEVTLNSINGTAECDEHNFPLGTIALKNPVKMKLGETVTVTITGKWTEEAIDHFNAAHPNEQNIKANLVGATTDAGGMIVQIPGPISLGEIPIFGS